MRLNKIKVVELFAGVGGFRVGLELSSNKFETIWANQWEPGKKVQHAFDCYVSHFGVSCNHVNEDIANVKHSIPPHNLLVGGFPCQDYSVARTGAQGIEGKKGVLWWHIRDILDLHRPNFIVLENVDRLIKSPGSQRGRDFAIMLRCLNDMGYGVEWRVINAAEYGYAQRRRRVYIVAFRNSTEYFMEIAESVCAKGKDIIYSQQYSKGFFSSIFPTQNKINDNKNSVSWIDEMKYADLIALSNDYTIPLFNSGIMINGQVISGEIIPTECRPVTLREIRHKEPVDEKYFLNGSLKKWQYLKGAKKIPRIRPNGEPYYFSEGGMCFPDDLDKPARTMLTSESSVNRSTHVIEDAVTGRLRLLTPVECERLNGFADDWTNTGMPEKFRYFTMGNALVVPIVEKIGQRLLEIM
ncbi:MAG: DNA (cytosine-5-)-methyltransferase [Defluviitaleaceae bacterium]|nr:DNA (cytosine-5-)-methyltransferase [Defluviitaleaceae bacterium]